MTSFLKCCCAFISKNLHIHFTPSQNVSLISLLDRLVRVTNEGSITGKCFNKETEGIFALILHNFSHIWNTSNIACHQESLEFDLLFISKFRFDWVLGKMLNDTHLMVMKIMEKNDGDRKAVF